MKKILLFAVLLSFTVNTTLHAQLKEEPYDLWDVLVGGRIGPSMSTLTNTDGKAKLWFHGCIFTEVFVNPNFSMTFEAGYSRKGANQVIIDPTRIVEEERGKYLVGPENPYDYNLDYLNTGYLLKYSFNQKLGIYTGINFSTLVSGKAKVKSSQNIDANNGEVEFVNDIKKELHGGEFTIPIGVELVFAKNFTLDARWNWSPRRVAKSDKARMLLGKARNQYLSLTIGYKILVF